MSESQILDVHKHVSREMSLEMARAIVGGSVSEQDREFLTQEVAGIIFRLGQSRDFHKARTEALNDWARSLPEPFQTEAFDIIANGQPRERPESEVIPIHGLVTVIEINLEDSKIKTYTRRSH